MQSKKFGQGKFTGTTSIKKVGQGWETSFVFGGKTVFVGNFIHLVEARQWFTIMNRQIATISKKYTVGAGLPVTWVSHFIGHQLYKTYYAHLDQVFTRYNKSFTTACVKDLKKYRQAKKAWNTGEARPIFGKKAA